MELQELIAHARQIAENPDCDAHTCAYQHDQLVDYLEELQRHRDLEAQGLKITVPCKIGDPVWILPKYNGKFLGIITEDKVQMIGITAKGIHIKARNHHDHNKMYMLGKTAFLSQKEAEQVLKGGTKS